MLALALSPGGSEGWEQGCLGQASWEPHLCGRGVEKGMRKSTMLPRALLNAKQDVRGSQLRPILRFECRTLK